MNIFEVVQEIIKLFWSMMPDNAFVIHVTEPGRWQADYLYQPVPEC